MRLFALLCFFYFEAALILSADANVFVYHRFNDLKHSSTSISNEKLKTDFQYFKDNNYNVIALSELVNMLKSGKKIPENTISLTIDDGYKSFYNNGLEVFKEFGYPFTIYVYVNATEKRYGDFMTWDELKDADNYGEIALHSFSHSHMTYLNKKEITEDTKKAKTIFQKRMGYAPASYAYPYGEFDDNVRGVIESFDFDFICNQNSGAVSEFSDPYSIDRIAVTDDTNIKTKLKIEALQVKNIEIKTINSKIINVSTEFIDKKIKSVEIYFSGYNWERVKVINGKLSYNTDKILKLDRTRVIIKHGNKMASKLIMKRK